MAKFKVIYTEVFKKVYIVEAENEEEAREKMELAAESVPGLITDEDFYQWDVDVEREANIKDLKKYELLREEKMGIRYK